MAGTLLGTLGIGITASLEGLSKGIDSASKSLTEFGKKAETMGKSISDTGTTMTKWVTGPIVAVGAAVTALAVNVGQFADNLMTQSLQTGISAKSLQEWRYIATLCGVSADAAVTAIYGLSRRMAELENDTGEGAEALAKLGLTFDDIRGKSPEDVFVLLLDRLSTIPDVLERNSIASKTLGLGWKEVAPIIAAGGDEIERLREEAHDLGVVISDEGIKAAADFDNAWDSITAQLAAAKNEMGISLAPMMRNTFVPIIQNTVIPAIKEFGEKLASIIKWFGDLPESTQKTIIKIVALTAAIGPAILVIGKLVTAVGLLSKALAALSHHPILLIITAITGLGAAWATAQQGLDSFGDYWNEFWTDLVNSVLIIYNKIGDGFEWVINKLSDGIRILTVGLVDLGHVDFADVQLLKSLEKVETIIRGIDSAADDLIVRFKNLASSTGSDAIALLAGNLEHLKYSLEGIPQPQALKEWERKTQELAETWKRIYPELSDQIDAVFSGTNLETFSDTVIKTAATIRTELKGITSIFQLGEEQFRRYQEAMMTVEDSLRELPGVDYATTFHGVLGQLIGDFADAWAFLQVLTPGTLDYANAMGVVADVVSRAESYLARLTVGTDEQREAAAGVVPILEEMVRLYGTISQVPVTSRLEEVTAQIDRQIAAMKLAGRGTIEYADGLEWLNGTLNELVGYQKRGVEGLDNTIAKLKGAIGPTDAWRQAIAALATETIPTVLQALQSMQSAISSAFSTFFDGIAEMKTANAELKEDYENTLVELADAEGEAYKQAAEQRTKELQDLSDDLSDGKITREQYTREAKQIEADFTKAVKQAAEARTKASEEELLAYEAQRRGVDDILSEMLKSFLKAAREQLQLEAAKWAVIAIAEGIALNFIGALKAAGAAAAYLAGAAGLAIAGFEKGGVVKAALGEPIPAIVHGGEAVFTPDQLAALGTIDYGLLGEAVHAGVYDAMDELGIGADRPLILQVDGKTFGRIALPLVQREKVRLGLEAV